MNDGRSMRAVKDSPVTRLVRNHLRTSEGEARKNRTSDGANLPGASVRFSTVWIENKEETVLVRPAQWRSPMAALVTSR